MTFRILLVKDRRPGHFRKAEGIAKAIARHRPVAIDEITVDPPRLPGGLLQRLPFSARAARILLPLIWRIRPERMRRPDLIISSGSETLVPNVLLAAYFGCRNIFSGSIRRIPPTRFSAIVHTHPAARTRARHIVVLLPSSVDPDVLALPQSFDQPAGRTIALLVGGPARGFQFTAADWDALQRVILDTARSGIAWWVTSSRRTPDATADALKALVEAHPKNISFLDFRHSQPGSSDPLFNADAILVTADSDTMIAEAVAARRPVVLLTPSIAAAPQPNTRVLIDEGQVTDLSMSEATPERLLAAIRASKPLSYNALERLYEELLSTGLLNEPSLSNP